MSQPHPHPPLPLILLPLLIIPLPSPLNSQPQPDLPPPLISIPPIHAETVDAQKIHINSPGIITLVLKSNQPLADRTRSIARSLDDLRGLKEWRLIVVIDFRNSLANLLPTIVRIQIRSNLDQEAQRLLPYYRSNGNPNSPRHDLHTIADFDGTIAEALGWNNKPNELAATLFNTKGYIHRRWSDLHNPQPLRRHLLRLLRSKNKTPSPHPTPPPTQPHP
ncbi:MAG: hypothetical protein NZM04_07255 [Methylacidiphilales bacterium]|nr:hypothetical protein [Candidatus Methylacidiphilales bacterium]MDW8349238.1 hypothetical protein [Verrucomicrobiae bacterium]